MPLSLKLSSKVLESREYLFISIQTSQTKIKQGFLDLESLFALTVQIKKNKKLIDENGSFSYIENQEKIETKELDKTYQMCKKCNVTCCQYCVWPNDSIESRCTYFHDGKGCPKCAKCPKSDHVRATYLIVKTQVPVKKEFSCKKLAYEEGQTGLSASQTALAEQKEKINRLAKEILDFMKKVKEMLKELDKIAMKPRLFTEEEYFLQMIKHEEDRKNPGYETRVKGLKCMLQQAKHIFLLSNSSHVGDIFPQYKQLIEELEIFEENSPENGPENGTDKNKACVIF